jgi:hypothetical protein
MGPFATYVDWCLDGIVDEQLLSRINAAWDQADTTFCSSPDRHCERVLVLAFDQDASDLEGAARLAADRVRRFAVSTALSGRIGKVMAYSDEASVTLQPDSDKPGTE